MVVASLAEATTTNGGSMLMAASSNNPQILHEIACAALAAVFTITWLHPIDVVKTRMQIIAKSEDKSNRTTYASLLQSIVSNEGWTSFYRGITVAWIAEAIYYGLQLGLYGPLKQSFSAKTIHGRSSTGKSTLSTKLLAGAFAGSFGALTGNPFVIVRTRMVANKGKRRNIATFVNDIFNDEGILGFYKGFSAMFIRCIVLSAAKMATYDTCKSFLRDNFLLDGIALQFFSAFVAGFFITGTVMPFDMIRTTMILSSRSIQTDEGRKRMTFASCVKDIYHHHGIGGFYRGAYAFWVRIAPKTCLQLIMFEQIKRSGLFSKLMIES